MAYSNVFVCLMGIGTVFFGLVCIIALSTVMSAACKERKAAPAAAAPAAAAPAPVVSSGAAAAAVSNRPEMIAAVSAALAEDMGVDVSAIRILSVKQL